MDYILRKIGILKSEILQNQWLLLGIAAGLIAIVVVFVLVIILLKKRGPKDGEEIPSTNAQKPSTDTHEPLTDIQEPLTATQKPAINERPQEHTELIELIKRSAKKYKSVLLASTSSESLPVTIAVNAAIELAKDKKSCLLIDLDLKRDAIAKAFDLDSNKSDLYSKASRTEFENLWVWPAHNFAQLKQMNIKAIVEKASDKFDFTLINAPSLTSSPDQRQIASAAQGVFICAKSKSEADNLAKLVKSFDCNVIDRVQIP